MRVIACIPAGRERYLSLSVPALLNQSIVDEVQLWVNTDVPGDLDFMDYLARNEPKVRLVYGAGELSHDTARDGHRQFNSSVSRFYGLCRDPNTAYIKLDDDVIWLADDCCSKMVSALGSDPNVFMVLGNLVNTPHSSLRHFQHECFSAEGRVIDDNPRCHATFFDGDFAAHIHRAFTQSVREGTTSRWHYADEIVRPAHHRIGLCAWRGEDMAPSVPVGNDEKFLTHEWPSRHGRVLMYCGAALAAHFASGHQETALLKTNILEEYRQL